MSPETIERVAKSRYELGQSLEGVPFRDIAWEQLLEASRAQLRENARKFLQAVENAGLAVVEAEDGR